MMKRENDSLEVPEKLRKLRRSKGMTVGQLAERIGENHQKVGRLERGQGHLTLDYVFKISEVLSTSIDDLLQRNESQPLESPSQSDDLLLTDIVQKVEREKEVLFSRDSASEKAVFITAVFTQAKTFPPQFQNQFVDAVIKIHKMTSGCRQVAFTDRS